MEVYFFWGGLGLIFLFLLIGFIIGLSRGIKRSAVHVLFALASIVLAFFITKPITNAVLGISVNINGEVVTLSDYIIQMISENVFDLSSFETASEFIVQLPTAIVNPIIFLVIACLTYFVFGILYLIIARISFGSKKNDFAKQKPHRLFGGVVGLVEAFLFIVVLFAPLTSLTNTYAEIMSLEPQSESTTTMAVEGELPSLSEKLNAVIPSQVNEIILAYNNCPIGKIVSAGGFDDALFDTLTDFKLDGEKISIRKELVNLADTYNNFAGFYNKMLAKDFSNLDFTNIKNNINILINNGLFKKVVTDTLQDIIVNYDSLKEQLNLNLPQVVEDVITNLQAKFSQENFNAYEYLSSDILKVVDVVDSFVKNGVLEECMNLSETSFENIMAVISSKSEYISQGVKDLLSLNIVTDVSTPILKYASDKVAEMFANEEEIFVGLNTQLSSTEISNMIDTIITDLNKLKTLNDDENILNLLNSDDVLTELLNFKNFGATVDSLAKILDDFNDLKIFNVENNGKTEKVVTNILKTYGIDLLGDEITTTEGTKTISTYKEFFGYIKQPIQTIINLGIGDVINGEMDTDSIIDALVGEIKENQNLLSDVLMPFYELTQANFAKSSLKEMAFDNFINSFSNKLTDFITLKPEEENYDNYKDNLNSLGQLFDVLNGGDIEGNTYLKYLLAEGSDKTNLIIQMNNDQTIDSLLNLVFEKDMFTPLVGTMFDSIDTELGNITGVKPTTNYSNLKQNKDSYISVIKSLLTFVDNNGEDIILSEYGTLLDQLKISAQEDVFKDVFVNLIWYLTGDVIDGNAIYDTAVNNNANAGDIKTYFGVPEANISTGYYEISYEDKMSEIDDVIALTEKIDEKLNGLSLDTEEDINAYITALKDGIDAMNYVDDDQAVTIINNACKLGTLLTDTSMKTSIETEVDSVFSGRDSLATAVKKLLFGENSGI